MEEDKIIEDDFGLQMFNVENNFLYISYYDTSQKIEFQSSFLVEDNYFNACNKSPNINITTKDKENNECIISSSQLIDIVDETNITDDDDILEELQRSISFSIGSWEDENENKQEENKLSDYLYLISPIVNEVLNTRYIYLSSLERSTIRNKKNFMIDLSSFDEVWSYISLHENHSTYYIRQLYDMCNELKQYIQYEEELKKIKPDNHVQSVFKLLSWQNEVLQLRNKIIRQIYLKELNNNDIHYSPKSMNPQMVDFNHIEEMTITNPTHKKLKPSKIQQQKEESGKDITLRYTVYKEDKWILKLIEVFDSYVGIRPIPINNFFKLLLAEWERFPFYTQQFLICIAEDILGGYSINNIELNLQKWIQTNHDIIPIPIKKYILI